MRSLRAALATSLAAVALLAGCTDDNPSPGDPSSTWTPTGKPETPTSSATAKPTEPALPEAATKATEAGARAFITYYWAVVNYAQATGDVKALKRASGRTCGGCNRLIGGISDLYEGGGHAVGGEYKLIIDRIKEITTVDKSAFGMELAIRVRNREQTIVQGSGETATSAPATSRYLTYLIWANEAWRTDIVEPR